MLYALGIRYVGETVARKLAEAFLSMDHLMEADQASLEQVDEIGERIAESLLSYFSDEQNRQFIGRLKAAGLQDGNGCLPRSQSVKRWQAKHL